jgi:hypothetical protein
MISNYRNYLSPTQLERSMKFIAAAITCLVAVAIPSIAISAEGQPIVKVGKHCPSGYRKSGEYCLPRSGSTHAAPSIEKKGSCPSGYRKNDEYCVPTSSSRKSPHIIEKKGSCPSGYRKSGKYCVERG